MAKTILDITREHCPMTFVKVKIAISKIQKGDILEVMLTEGEPLTNVPKSAAEAGHKILGIEKIKDKIFKVVIEK